MPRGNAVKNIIGQKFGKLTVISFSHLNKTSFWNCLCDCRNTIVVRKGNLTSGNTTSCGCFKTKKAKSIRNELTGKVFGRLTVIELAYIKPKGGSYWTCKCECGKMVEVRSHLLTNGSTKSCGCWRVDNTRAMRTTHGQSRETGRTDEYRAYSLMKRRCYNPNSKDYKRHGGRGITVCDRWLGEHGFENFFADMGKKPSKEYSLDRYPNNETGNYEPSNCRWGTDEQQARNRRDNIWLEANGKTMLQTDWENEIKLDRHLILKRLRRGKSFQQIVDEHLKKHPI